MTDALSCQSALKEVTLTEKEKSDSWYQYIGKSCILYEDDRGNKGCNSKTHNHCWNCNQIIRKSDYINFCSEICAEEGELAMDWRPILKSEAKQL